MVTNQPLTNQVGEKGPSLASLWAQGPGGAKELQDRKRNALLALLPRPVRLSKPLNWFRGA